MDSDPVIHRRQRRVVIVANVQSPAAPAPAIAETKANRPVLKLKARPQAAANPESSTGITAPAKPAKPAQEPLSADERSRRLATKAAAALKVLAEHYPALFTSVRPMAIGTSKVLDAERKAGRLPPGCIPLKLALSAWAASNAYFEAVSAGGTRFSLAGEVDGDVTPEQVAYALKKLKRRRDLAAVQHEQAVSTAASASLPR